MTAQAPGRIDAAALLQTYDVVSMQQMGRQHGVDIKGKSKKALATLLAKTLYDPNRIKRSLDDLAPVERQVLNRIILTGGEVATGTLRRVLQEEGLVAAPPEDATSQWSYARIQGSVTKKGSTRFEDIIGRLGVLGLVFSRSSTHWRQNIELRTPGVMLFIPEGILRHLPAVTLTTKTAAPPARELPGSPDDILRDVYTFAHLARSEPLQLTVGGPMAKRALVRVDAALRRPEGAAQARSEADLGRLPFLRALAEELGLVAPSANMLGSGADLGAFFTRPRGWRLQQLVDAYRRTALWSELSRLRDVSITPRGGIRSPYVAAARKRVLAEVAELQRETGAPAAGAWISLDHLVARMRARAYDFLLPRIALYERYAYYPQYDAGTAAYWDNPLGLQFSAPDEETPNWNLVEGSFIREVVAEPLHWLGLVDLGTASQGQEFAPQVFRVTEAGARVLRGEEPNVPAPETRVVIQPNFQVLAFEPADESVLFTLDRLARRVRSEQVTEYQLTRESVYAAQREGLESRQIIALLERLSATPLPQNVRRTIEDWGAQLDRIVIRRHVAAVQSVDEATLDRLAADPGLGRMLGTRLAPTLALVPPPEKSGGVSALAGALLAREGRDGIPLPAVSEGNDAGMFPAITIDREGTITLRDLIPSVYVQQDVRRVADEDSEGRMRLEASRLRQIARDIGREHDPASVVLRRLELLQGGPLPEEVVLMVRRWAQDWGRGALVETVLLQVERPEIMGELLADPELQRFIRVLPGAPALAMVQASHAEEVRAALQDRGMELQSRLL